MIYLYWNSKGLANNPTKLALRRLITKNKLDFLFISEPLMIYENFPQNWFSNLGLKLIFINERPKNIANLWCFRKCSFDHVILSIGEQNITFASTFDDKYFELISVYASTSYLGRRFLCLKLSFIISIHKIPWIILGDFNVVIGAHEHFDVPSLSRLPVKESQDCSNQNELLHLPNVGAYYTCSNGRVCGFSTLKRLDKVICNME